MRRLVTTAVALALMGGVALSAPAVAADRDSPTGPGTTGFGYVPILTCDGTAQSYQAEVVSNSDRQFKRGAARATASGYV